MSQRTQEKRVDQDPVEGLREVLDREERKHRFHEPCLGKR